MKICSMNIINFELVQKFWIDLWIRPRLTYQSSQIWLKLVHFFTFIGLKPVKLFKIDTTDQCQPFPERPGVIIAAHCRQSWKRSGRKILLLCVKAFQLSREIRQKLVFFHSLIFDHYGVWEEYSQYNNYIE